MSKIKNLFSNLYWKKKYNTLDTKYKTLESELVESQSKEIDTQNKYINLLEQTLELNSDLKGIKVELKKYLESKKTKEKK